MKKYIAPAQELICLNAKSTIMLGSKVETNDKLNGFSESEQLSRQQHHGIGGGLWEDMK